MKLIVFTICWNRIDILPWWLRHYSSFVDEISVFDEQSNDGTRELLRANPKVLLRDWPHKSGIDENLFLQHAYEWYPRAHPKFDWAIWADTDEFVWAPNLLDTLKRATDAGIEVIAPTGFNMVNEGLPVDDGRQIWEVCRKGVYAPIYSKPIVFRPGITIHWDRGKHHLEQCSPKIWFEGQSDVKLLHYRYLGYEYTRRRNALNLDRCGLYNGDKGAAWSCRPDYKGEGSAEWAKEAMRLAVDVV